ncbi:MAG TPA: diaminopimelate epimerase [Gammaproteobacteria bacterium]|nr:diaminopimelate epimerase [Gammaproteobacteria bacterium]
MTSFAFTKMHALGNDFIVINNLTLNMDKNPSTIARLGNRHLGIGFDQALLIEPSTRADFFCCILNTDGSEAEQCGNGLRCVALYLKMKKLHTHPTLTIETRAGVFPIRFCDDGDINITLGKPQSSVKSLNLTVGNHPFLAHTVSMGNPHCLIQGQVERASTIGEALNHQHPAFPEGVNVGFMTIVNPHHVRLQTFERGVGFTNACGSNAAAAAIVGITEGVLRSPVTVEFRYGSLNIAWDGEGQPVVMQGPASFVFEGMLI